MSSPYETFLSNRSPKVAARILRLNGKNPPAGNMLRGWHPTKTARRPWMDICSRSEFIKRKGRAAYDALPKAAFHREGKRKYVKGIYCL